MNSEQKRAITPLVWQAKNSQLHYRFTEDLIILANSFLNQKNYPGMISKKMEKALNRQIEMEGYASFLYLSSKIL